MGTERKPDGQKAVRRRRRKRARVHIGDVPASRRETEAPEASDLESVDMASTVLGVELIAADSDEVETMTEALGIASQEL